MKQIFSIMPLLEVFSMLREHNFQLGLDDYFLALEGISKGLVGNSRTSLTLFCQTLWGKSKEEKQFISQLLEKVLPDQLSLEELEALELVLQEATEINQSSIKHDEDLLGKGDYSQTEKTKIIQEGIKQHDSLEDTEVFDKDNYGFSFQSGYAQNPDYMSALSTTRAQFDLNFDFEGNLPITRRHMKTAWKYYRRVRRSGPRVELDIAATIERIHEQGIFLGGVFIPRRTNIANLLILKDEKGSMHPFRQITQNLLETAASVNLPRLGVYFFHDVPLRNVFEDVTLLYAPIPLDEVLSAYGSEGILIISDGGAARRTFDEHRLEQTVSFINQLRTFSQNVAWLNPVPQERWIGTTAQYIWLEGNIPMFSLDRQGLHATVNTLRGH